MGGSFLSAEFPKSPPLASTHLQLASKCHLRVLCRRVSGTTGSWDYQALVGLTPSCARRCAPPKRASEF